MSKIYLALVEDDKVIRESLSTYLGQNPLMELVFVTDSVEKLISEIKMSFKPKVDVLILDIGLPGMSGIEGIPHVRSAFPEVDIIMLTTYEEEDKIFDALCAGACSYLSKRTPLSKIQESIITVSRGGSYMSPMIARKVAEYFRPKHHVIPELTKRQTDIVDGIKEGLSYKMIGAKLDISVDTVRDHIKKIYRALEVNSKTELIRKLS